MASSCWAARRGAGVGAAGVLRRWWCFRPPAAPRRTAPAVARPSLFPRRAPAAARRHYRCGDRFCFSPEVADAFENRRAASVVALESTIISHGMPFPENVETAVKVEETIREGGGVPATVAVLDGKIHVGLTPDLLEKLGKLGKNARKTSRRDLAAVVSQGITGATTVASTMLIAHRAGIKLFVTGGIGGVHRGAEHSMDISADLNELGRTPVAVICAGVKSILDISKTLEYLETQGVTVATVSEEHADFPAFFARSSGERSPLTLRDAEGCAALIAANHQLELNSGMVFAVPIPQEQSFEGNEVERAIKEAVEEAERKSITGRDVTPFILKRVNELSCGRSLSANVALVLNNAKVGAAIARHLQILEDAAQGSAFAASNLSQVTSPTFGASAGELAEGRDGERSAGRDGERNAGRDGERKRRRSGPLVVGGMALDVTSTVDPGRVSASASLLDLGHTSHPGEVSFSAGGVGRNIAEAAARILRPRGDRDALSGMAVAFVTACGDDAPSRMLLSHMQAAGVPIDRVLKRADARTAVYSAIHSSKGELMGAVSDMRVLESLSGPEVRAAVRSTSPCMVVLDANLSPGAMGSLLSECQARGIPVFFEPTSVPKSRRIFAASPAAVTAGVVRYASPNEYELAGMAAAAVEMERRIIARDARARRRLEERMSAENWEEERWMAESCRRGEAIGSVVRDATVLLRHIPTLFIKLGARGVVLAERHVGEAPFETALAFRGGGGGGCREEALVRWNAGGARPGTLSFRHVAGPRTRDVEIVSVTGAGDSFVGAVVAGLAVLHGCPSANADAAAAAAAGRRDLAELVEAGQVAALRSLATKEAVSPLLCRNDMPESWRAPALG